MILSLLSVALVGCVAFSLAGGFSALLGARVLIGAGVNAAVIDELRAALPGARAFHASCKTLLESGMTFRREGVPMGLPGLDEWHIQQTDADAVRAAKAAVMR